LYKACENGNEAIVKYLIEQGDDINKENWKKETPLFNVYESGSEVIVKYLVEHGADINIKNCYGNTTLSIAHKKWK